jgi:replicative DNA helicase
LIEKHFNVKVGVIGVDYLGLMDGQGQGEYEIVSKLARDLKGLAKLLNIPVIVISQTSRKAGSGDVEVSLDMGRGSGAIEESADFVLGLYQVEEPKLSVESDEPAYRLICKILKNRKGPKGSRWRLDLNPENLRLGPDAEPFQPPKKKQNDSL